MIQKNNFLLLAFLLLLCGDKALGQTVADKILAIVGDKIILQSEIEVLFIQAKSTNPATPASYRCDLLQQKMLEKMLITQALRDSLQISEGEVESNLDRRIRYFVSMLGSKEKFEAYYKKSIEEMKDQFRDEIRDGLLAQQMQSTIAGSVKCAPVEVKNYFNALPLDSLPMFGASAELVEIARIPKVSSLQDSLALAKCKDLRLKLLNGSDFALLAKLNSQDPGSAKNGGDLGEMERGVLVPEFESVAFVLRDNELSEPVKTDFGYHLIQTLKNLGNRIKVRHILIKPEITTDDAIDCINQLDSIKKEIIKKTILFEDAVQKYSDESNSKSMNGILTDLQTGQIKYELSSMDADLRKAVDAGQIGDITDPLVYSQPNGDNAFRIVLIKNKTPEHRANLINDYQRIQEVASQDKQQKAMQNWVKDSKVKYYIWVDDEYKSCETLQQWF